jgi:hypothetical protein
MPKKRNVKDGVRVTFMLPAEKEIEIVSTTIAPPKRVRSSRKTATMPDCGAQRTNILCTS